MAKEPQKQKQTSSGSFSYVGGSVTSWLGIIFYILVVFALVVWVVFALGCVINIFGQKFECGFSAVNNMLATGGIILTWSAALFDLTLQRGVLNAGYWLRAGGGFGLGIAAVWEVLRDLVNLALIGGLVWASISMILNTGQQIGKLIVQIVIAALLVNFSFFFAGAVLDASHFASRVIYEEAFGVTVGTPGAGEENNEGFTMASRFMQATHLGSLSDISVLGTGNNGEDQNFIEDPSSFGILMLMGLVALIVLVVAAWVFFSVAALFTQRFIVIIILLMTAPIGILAFTDIPRGKEYGQGWWAALWSQAIFPPVLLILLAASFKVLEVASNELVQDDASFLGLFVGPNGGGALSGVSPGQLSSGPWGAAWELVTVYIIGIGLMYASMKIATNIAKQEPLKVPTTGQIYGQYKKAFKPIMQIPKAIGSVGKLPAPPFLRDRSGRPYANLGEALTFAPDRRSRPAAPWDIAGQRGNREWARRQDAWDSAQTGLVLANRELEEATELGDADAIAQAEARRQDALRKAAIAWNQMPDGEGNQRDFNRTKAQTPNEEQAAKGITKPELDRAVDEAEVESPNVSRYVEVGGGQTASSAPTNQQATKIAEGSYGMGTRDAIKQLNQTSTRLALIDMAKEGRTATRMIQAFRENGKNGESQVHALPKQALQQQEVKIRVNGKELINIGERNDITVEEWNDIAGGANDEAREYYENNARRGLKKKKPLPPKVAPSSPQTSEDAGNN